MVRKSILIILLLPVLAFRGMTNAQGGETVERALEALKVWQQPDGGFSNGFSEGSDVGMTADAVLAILAGGSDPTGWIQEGRGPLDFLAEQASSGDVKEPGVAAKVAMAVQAAGLNPRDFHGTDLIAAILAGYDPSTGFFGLGPFDSSLSILALVAAREALPEGAVDGLLAARLPDGSLSFNGNMTPGSGDSNTTAMAVQALIAAGAADQIGPSMEYFRSVQNEDGGWTYQKPSAYGEATDANSTALVIQALLAAGEDLDAWGNPRDALLSLQVPSGAFIFNAATSAESPLATVQAIPALAGVDFSDIPALAAAHQSSTSSSAPSTTLVVGGALVGLVVVLGAAVLVARRRS